MFSVMKTTMKNTVAIIMLVLLPALTGAAQAGAVEYKSTYKQSAISYPPSGFSVATTATAPTATFQSTSAYSGQWSEQSSMLNSDGSVNAGAYMGGKNNAPGMRKAPGTPTDEDEEEEERQPLGDAALPLLLLALAYMGIRIYRRKTT